MRSTLGAAYDISSCRGPRCARVVKKGGHYDHAAFRPLNHAVEGMLSSLDVGSPPTQGRELLLKYATGKAA